MARPAIKNSAEVYDPASNTWSAAGSLWHRTSIPYRHAAAQRQSACCGRIQLPVRRHSIEQCGTVRSGKRHVEPGGKPSASPGNFTTETPLLPNGKVLSSREVPVSSAGTVRSSERHVDTSGEPQASNALDIRRRCCPAERCSVAGGIFDSKCGSVRSRERYLACWRPVSVRRASMIRQPCCPTAWCSSLEASTMPTRLLSSAELYDPSADTWILTGNLSAARSHHTATLLPNGKVLGSRWNGHEQCFEQCGSVRSGNQPVERGGKRWDAAPVSHGHIAVQWQSALVAGGFYWSSVGEHYLGSAELYDPAFSMWNAAGSLNTARYVHTATLLPNGKVLGYWRL